MSFMIQYKCPKCGFQTPGYNENDGLIDPWDMPELYICSCSKCQKLFHRKKDSEGRDICKFCGSTAVTVYPSLHPIPCPCCGEPDMKLECVGTCF